MKKLACLGVLLCLALSIFVTVPTAVSVSAADDDSFVIYVYDEQEWDLNIYCHSDDKDFGPGWPGTELDKAPELGLGEDWYSFTMPSDPTGKDVYMIIFDRNNNEINRVQIKYNKATPYYHTYVGADKGFETPKEAIDDAETRRPDLVDTVYIYNYSITDGEERWKDIYASCYNDKTGDSFVEDQPLEPAPLLGEYWYQFKLPENAIKVSKEDYKFRARIVVSDGGRERLVIVAPVEAKKYYNTYRDYGFAKAEDAADNEFNCVYKNPRTGTTTLYYYNTQRWKTVYAYSYWTYKGANNTTVEDFEGWPGKPLRPVEGHENWYSIELPQDFAELKRLYGVDGVGVVFNSDTKGRIKKDAYLTDSAKVYVNYGGEIFSSFEACERVSTMIDPLPEVGDYLLNFDDVDTSEKTLSVTEYKYAPEVSLIAPIVVLSIAGVVCIAFGTVFIVFTVRRKKK